MRMVYPDVCKITGARDEIVLLFGKSRMIHGGREERSIELLDRVVMTPPAAKRFFVLLSNVLKDYEERYGPIRS